MVIMVIFRVEIREGKEEEYRKISAEVLEVAKEQEGLISMETINPNLMKQPVEQKS